MKKVHFIFAALAVNSIGLFAQQSTDSLKQVELDEIIVSATRVKLNAPVAYSNMNEQQIKKNNAAKNIPSILQTLPSVVSYTEGGTGIGNTSYRIRGTDANRINVTLNGMPLNNPESQEVYWVNLPNLSNSLKSIQVQRGVGTVTNGSAAFGASISLETTSSRAEAYGEASTAIGSYHAFSSSIATGTGILKNGLSFDGQYSKTTGKGYIRNGKVDHQNIYASLSHYTSKQLIRLSYMNGIQHTGITWVGVDPDMMKVDRKYNSAGRYTDDAGNVHYYGNETDNYYSNITQLVFSRHLGNALTLNANLSHNNGYGYYENYKTDQSLLSKFGIQPQEIGGVTYKKSDVIRRKFLSNDLYSSNINLNYKKESLNISMGTMYSYFDGSHYGKLPWVKYNQNVSPDYKWYLEKGTKRDMNTFLKAEYNPIKKLNIFAEAQYRYVDYRLKGKDDDMVNIGQNNYYSFFNPKVGASFRFLDRNEVYASFGVSNREPLRADLKESVKGGSSRDITSERLYDYEMGYKYTASTFAFEMNLYYMDYKDQFVQTGRLSDTGYKLQQNVPDSYRMGIELSAVYNPVQWLRLDANTTLSRNKIKNYTAYYTVYDAVTWAPLHQETEFFKSTNISFSPNLVGSGIITFIPTENTSLSLVNKYVGKMYYDNTSNKENQLDDYFVSDLVASYTFDMQKVGKVDLQFFVYNIWNKKYVANAWVDPYRFNDDSVIIYKGLFPQAPCNIMTRVGIRF